MYKQYKNIYNDKNNVLPKNLIGFKKKMVFQYYSIVPTLDLKFLSSLVLIEIYRTK
jgi:hypothetical protein